MGINAQISEDQLAILIPQFYSRVCEDALIGPIFKNAIDDWKHHREKFVAFWSSVLLTSGRYKRDPIAAHLKHLPILTPSMFDRWLALWAEVTDELLSPEAAIALQKKRRASPKASSWLCISVWNRRPGNLPVRCLRRPEGTGHDQYDSHTR